MCLWEEQERVVGRLDKKGQERKRHALVYVDKTQST